jgi:SAM-dependent methyltransferase
VATADKRSRMLGELDLATSMGLEIGPLNAPLVRKSEGRVRYVDYAPTDVLRKSQFDSAVDTAAIVDVDIVWGGMPLRDIIGEPVDYVLASHVIEHAPDIIGWLHEMHAALKPGGTLGLAVPDRRFTFDVRRHESTLAEMVEACLLEYRRPSIRQIFDVSSLAIAVDAEAAWRGDLAPSSAEEVPTEKLQGALRLARGLVENPRYIDAHCWVFTPRTFLDRLDSLARLGMFSYAVADFFPTEPGSIEFQIRLIALPSGSAPEIVASIDRARRILAQTETRPPHDGGEPADANAADTAAASRYDTLERENEALRAEIAALRSSTSWRLTAPLRGVISRLRRLTS